MKRTTPRRLPRASLPFAAGMALLLGAAPAREREDAMERLRAAVDAEAARLRAELDARESGRDWSGLLERKCTVDAALAPVHFLADAAGWEPGGDADAAGPDLLRSFRAEWRAGPVSARWSHPDAPARVRRALAAWLPASGRVTADVRTGSARWVHGDAPVALEWTVTAEAGPAGPAVHARCWWRAPLAEPVRIDFPLAADGFDLWVDRAGARYADDRGQSHQERWEPSPIFNNPPDLYAAFDGLRSMASGDRAVEHRVPPGTGDAGRDAGPGATCVRQRHVATADGRLLRTEEWRWEDGRLRSVEIDQAPVRLLHHAEQGAILLTEIDGVEASRAEHRPSSEIVHLATGARIVIGFRDADPARDTVHGDAGTATVPDRIEVWDGGAPVAWADFGSVRVDGPGAPDATQDAERVQGSARCREIAARIAHALDARADVELHEAVRLLAEAHESLGVPRLQRACEWELLASRVHAAGMLAQADGIIVARVLALDAEGAGAAAGRAQARGEAAFAARLAEIAGIDRPAAVARDATAAGHGTHPADPPCDAARPGTPARELFDAIEREIRGSRIAPEHAEALAAALCQGLGACGPGIAQHGADNLARLPEDARAVLAVTGWPEDPEAFAARACRAASATAPDAGEIAACRRAWDGCADAALRALARAIARHRQDAAAPVLEDAVADARDALRAWRALVRNAFVPSLDVYPGEGTPDAASIARRAEAGLAAACDREAERLAAVRDVIGGPLAEARAGAARRRLARTAVEAAAGEFLRWASPDRAPPGG